jgi:predicted membrane protein
VRAGSIALGALLLAAGLIWMLEATDVVDLDTTVWLAILLVGTGIAVIATPRGAGRRFLIVIGILLAVATAAASVVDVDVRGGIGEDREHPADAAQLEPRYDQGIGRLELDFRDVDLDEDETVDAELGIGDLVVRVPDGVDVEVDAHAGVGHIEAFGEEDDGTDADLARTFDRAGTHTLELQLDVGVGSIRVEG